MIQTQSVHVEDNDIFTARQSINGVADTPTLSLEVTPRYAQNAALTVDLYLWGGPEQAIAHLDAIVDAAVALKRTIVKREAHALFHQESADPLTVGAE